MSEPRQKYRPPRPGPLHLREAVRRHLLALAGADAPDATLEAALVEDVERALKCELPDEILACFANGDDTLHEHGFRLAEIADLTAWARRLLSRRDIIGVGHDPDSHVLYCIDRRGDRRRAVGLTEVETVPNGDTQWIDLGDWLAARAERLVEDSDIEPEPRLPQPSPFVQLLLFEEVGREAAMPQPATPQPAGRGWRLV